MADDRDGNGAFWSKVQHEELPHCGLCDPATRHVELEDGRIGRCPRCWPPHGDKPGAPPADALLPQTWRCPACRALIFRDQRGLPCDKHRTVTGTHRDYDAAQSAQEPLMPNPVTERGAALARTMLAERPRPAVTPERPADPTAGLFGEALARAQAAESRAARRVGDGEPVIETHIAIGPDPDDDDDQDHEPDPDDQEPAEDDYRPPF